MNMRSREFKEKETFKGNNEKRSELDWRCSKEKSSTQRFHPGENGRVQEIRKKKDVTARRTQRKKKLSTVM